jgi:hypothetical protein
MLPPYIGNDVRLDEDEAEVSSSTSVPSTKLHGVIYQKTVVSW